MSLLQNYNEFQRAYSILETLTWGSDMSYQRRLSTHGFDG